MRSAKKEIVDRGIQNEESSLRKAKKN